MTIQDVLEAASQLSQNDRLQVVIHLLETLQKPGQEKIINTVSEPEQPPKIIRTERGLTIAGTRITLYDVMDYVTAQYPPEFIRGLFNLSSGQINAALAYIEENRTEVEAEYQTVLREAEELQRYYEEKNRDLIKRLAEKPIKPGQEAIRAKLQAAKAKF